MKVFHIFSTRKLFLVILLPFTLVELLVVVSILSILFAMFLPALQMAQEQGRSIFCTNNLRQMSQAAVAYTVNYDGYFPLAYENPPGPGSISWDLKTVGLIGNCTYEPGPLWEYVDISSNTSKIQQCPTFQGADMWAGEAYTGYNYNTSYIGHGNGVSSAQEQMVKNPESTIIFGDGGYDGGSSANKFMRAPFGDKKFGDLGFNGRAAGTQHFRHTGKANVSFVDGHTGILKTIYRNSYNNEIGNVFGKCGWASEDDSLYDLE